MSFENPFLDWQWEELKREVLEEASRTLVGRRFLSIWGPLKPGLQYLKTGRFARDHFGELHMVSDVDPNSVQPEREDIVPVPMIFKDFIYAYRDVEYAREHGIPVDPTIAIRAAHFCADSEDELIFNGNADLGLDGLLSVKGRHVIPMGDWNTSGSAYGDVTKAIDILLEHNFHGPYAMVVAPSMYHQLSRAHRGAAFLEIDPISRLIAGGIFMSVAVPETAAVIVSTGKQNFDLAVTEDLTVTYMPPVSKNHPCRVHESLVLRIKRPEAIAVIEKRRGGAGRAGTRRRK
ncbi:MAG TPA: family 1 encapsulin nanocompartment shell protein [Candidatus Saccharimonadales bacterium]|nr:family 1 encapsulin nanocompartment shell protein [Candidatus Saccharimonadales bacterium]